MIRALALALTLVAGDAAALSCLALDPARMFTEAAESDQEYVVLLGTVSFDDSQMPRGPAGVEAPAPLPAAFSGHLLTEDGFTSPWEGPMTLHPTCFGDWCGFMESPSRVMAFAINDAAGPVLIVDACSSKYVVDPPADWVDRVVTCMQGGACSPAG